MLENTVAVQLPVEVDETTKTSVESETLGKLAQLPPFNPVAVAVLRCFDRDDVDIPNLARLINSDAALAAEVLAYANSPMFSLQVAIGELRHAIAVIGLEHTKSVTTTLTMRGFLKSAPKPSIVRRLWRHNIATSVIAKRFARVFGVPKDLAETVGMVHDLGRVGLLAAFREEYPALVVKMYDSPSEVLHAEAETFKMDHCEAGLFLSASWGFPQLFQDAIAMHHEGEVGGGLTGLLRISCALADDFDYAAVAHRDRMQPLQRIAACVPEELRAGAAECWHGLGSEILERIERLDG